jgi:type II secretory ATPase GspE/PulE/Tfp pilus assembly ATPase PilB-like protein
MAGPTGSGKATTLYACMNRIDRDECRIITIEDAIEYRIDGVTQIQIHPKIGLTFSRGLRSMLRHDPDVMMVGEIRDVETAEITIRVALTGHLVFSTLHTNDAASAVTRLIDMGVEPYLAASSIDCIIAQRLVRVICPECREVSKEERAVLAGIGGADRLEGAELYVGRGCERCRFTGYHGRTAIYEFLTLTDEIRDRIVRRVPSGKIRDLARANGMLTLRETGLEKVRRGITTVSEVLRVTQAEEECSACGSGSRVRGWSGCGSPARKVFPRCERRSRHASPPSSFQWGIDPVLRFQSSGRG